MGVSAILLVILGTAVGVIPGILAVMAFFRHQSRIEKIVYSIMISISIAIIIGLALGYLRLFTLVNVVIAYLFIVAALILALLTKKHLHHRRRS